MRKVTSVAQASQLLAVACEDLPTVAGEEEDQEDDRPRYIRPANVSSLQNLPVPTASGSIVRFGSRRYKHPLCPPVLAADSQSSSCNGLTSSLINAPLQPGKPQCKFIRGIVVGHLKAVQAWRPLSLF